MKNIMNSSQQNTSQLTTAGATPDQKKNFVNYANLEEMEAKIRDKKFEELDNEAKEFVDYS